MERLENIVEAMESGDLPLETMLERYEEGTRMVALCTQKLAAAQKRIEIITQTPAGEPQSVAFDPEAAPPEPAPRPSRKKDHTDDDISLF